MMWMLSHHCAALFFSLVREAASGSGHDAEAAAHSRALAMVSRDIAAAIRALDSAGSKPIPPAPPTPTSPAPAN